VTDRWLQLLKGYNQALNSMICDRCGERWHLGIEPNKELDAAREAGWTIEVKTTTCGDCFGVMKLERGG
jgi:hypothetical protein